MCVTVEATSEGWEQSWQTCQPDGAAVHQTDGYELDRECEQI